MGVKIRKRRGIFHLVVCYGGKRFEESTGLHDSENPVVHRQVMKVVEQLRGMREIQMAQKLNGLETKESRQTIYDYAATVCVSKGASSGMPKCLPYLEKFGGTEIKIGAVTPKWFEDFQERMIHDSGLKSAHTQEKYCCIVRQVLKKAARDGLLPRDPSSGIKHIPVPDSRKEFLTVEEVRRMAVTPYERKGSMPKELQNEIRKAFLFGCCTGFRVSDLSLLVWGDIDIGRMEIVRRQKKTKKLVVVPMKAETLAIIHQDGDSHDQGDHVFPSLSCTKTTTNRYLKGWATAAGIKKNVTWHTARHTDATMLLEYGADLYTVMRLLGHTKVQTTMQYAVVSDRKKRDAVDNVPSLCT